MTKGKTAKKIVDYLAGILLTVVVILLIMNISCFIAQYENNYELKQRNKELVAEKNNGELLLVEYEKLTNYHTVEDYVTKNLGMTKLNPYQTEYIVSTNTNETLLIREEENDDSILGRIARAFSIALAYFR